MIYNINPMIFSSTFAIPADVADKYLKLCEGSHLKVLIYILRNIAKMPSVEDISNEIDISVFDVKEALLFWADTGIITIDINIEKTEHSTTVKKALKPTRTDVAKRGLEDTKLHYLLNQTQIIFGRNLKGNEVETLGWLYDDVGLDVSLILYIIGFAKQQGKANIRFIESIATDWADKGVETIADAEEQVKNMAISDQAWKLVMNIFGIERRSPSKKESELSVKWINEWGISKELLKHAYDTCIDTKSKYSFSYIAKIIENWHNDGYKTVDDIDAKPKNDKKMQGAYNIDLFEKMLNSKE